MIGKHFALPIAALTAFSAASNATSEAKKPNFIVILTDDQGYGDLGCFNPAAASDTPNLDRMAAQGIKLTSFYAAPFCAPSRAQIMTGSYHSRVSHSFNPMPHANSGLHPDEITVAEILKRADYSTKIIGKWHLGDHKEFFPTRQGFDEFFGIPYSNDMWPYYCAAKGSHPRLLEQRERAKKMCYSKIKSYQFPDMPLMRNEKAIEINPDQTQLTKRYTSEALKFIKKNKENPFFMYLAHAMPHVPLYVSNQFKGKSKRGLYGDVTMEIDWSCGQIVKKLKELNLDKNTLIIYTSDNGPWLKYKGDGGSNGPLREGKGTTWEGGTRVPTIAYWPSQIPAGLESDLMLSNIDILPTFAKLAGVGLPQDRKIDGRDIMPLLKGESKVSPHNHIHYIKAGYEGVRNNRYKLVLKKAKKGKMSPIALYDLKNDIGEKKNIIKSHPEIADELNKAAQKFCSDVAENKRPCGKVKKPIPPSISHLK